MQTATVAYFYMFNFRSFTWMHWRSVSLACGLSVSVVKAPSMRMCSVPGTCYMHMYIYFNCVFTSKLWLSTQRQSFVSANSDPLTPLQPGLSHLLHEEEGSERPGWPGQVSVSLWMVISSGTLFLLCLISDDRGLLFVSFWEFWCLYKCIYLHYFCVFYYKSLHLSVF